MATVTIKVEITKRHLAATLIHFIVTERAKEIERQDKEYFVKEIIEIIKIHGIHWITETSLHAVKRMLESDELSKREERIILSCYDKFLDESLELLDGKEIENK